MVNDQESYIVQKFNTHALKCHVIPQALLLSDILCRVLQSPPLFSKVNVIMFRNFEICSIQLILFYDKLFVSCQSMTSNVCTVHLTIT